MQKNGFVARMLVFCMSFVMMVSVITVGSSALTPVKASEQEFPYTGTLDVSAKGWDEYYPGLNYDLTGGKAGTIRQGAKLTVISEQTNKNGNKVSYCYSEDLQQYCYVSSRYICKDKTEETVIPGTDGTEKSATVQEHMDELVELLDGKYFTVNQEACSNKRLTGHGCTNCSVASIVNTDWFKNMFGAVDTICFPEHDVNSSRRDHSGRSCFGFACFAQWYLYKSNNSDKVIANRVATGKFNKSFAQENIQPGDVLRIANSHSVVVYSVGDSGVTVIDCNWNRGGQLNCLVQKHTIPYSNAYCKNKTTYVNRVTEIISNQCIALDVPLYVQVGKNTCGVSNVKMILDYLDVKNASDSYYDETTLWKWANSNKEGTYVYRVAQTLTHYGVPYKYIKMTSSVEDKYWDELKKSLDNNRPVIVPILPTKNSYWKYNTGHYVLVTGIYEDENGKKQVILNDCHYSYSAKDKVVALEELIRVNKRHSSYLIVGK